jgi:hypothetical protein
LPKLHKIKQDKHILYGGIMELEDYQELLRYHRRAQFFQGADLASLNEWTGKPDFSLCLDLWFWAYSADNSIYPDLMIVSSTPFWSKGQAEIDLSVRIDKLERKIDYLMQERNDKE